jgi:uncharacterized membrane protein YfcA
MSNELASTLVVLGFGFLAGVLSGMFGIGGGLVIVPALVVVLGMSIKSATATSLFALMWPVGLLGVIAYWREGYVDARAGLWIAIGLFLGAYLGARVTLALPATAVRRGYAVFLLVAGTYLLWTNLPEPATVRQPDPPAGQVH